MIRKAAEFAARAHEGALRKGSKIPYISHPMEVAMIVALMTDDQDLIAAAYLHDVIEDAGVTYQELEQKFGSRIAELVRQESEDKSKSWVERKQATIDRLITAGKEDRILAFGDKLSNLRSTAKDYMVVGDEIWQKFRAKDKNLQAWYYESMVDSFAVFREHPFYREYLWLLNMVFGWKSSFALHLY
ncbi:MAG: bifunctional (p)ppGpp synthetase/guanosine-3',5'-bis(diphosphate) 3'-pyrophosphohydrolase [Hungatella sp.]|jgi:guanosine-3',5'-bis(diphosphate) 3'-pyrophosphohydrolase|nr:bifunctional (p)ppGpp synthetase/guanosine-3',5'-bis(diphosphate) 3'-pyrophosphohydrolase [Hungatella sp.]